MTLKAQRTTTKTDKLDFVATKNSGASKDIIKKVKRQPIDWEKIFVRHISGKGLGFRIYKLLQLNSKDNAIKDGQRS